MSETLAAVEAEIGKTFLFMKSRAVSIWVAHPAAPPPFNVLSLPYFGYKAIKALSSWLWKKWSGGRSNNQQLHHEVFLSGAAADAVARASAAGGAGGGGASPLSPPASPPEAAPGDKQLWAPLDEVWKTSSSGTPGESTASLPASPPGESAGSLGGVSVTFSESDGVSREHTERGSVTFSAGATAAEVVAQGRVSVEKTAHRPSILKRQLSSVRNPVVAKHVAAMENQLPEVRLTPLHSSPPRRAPHHAERMQSARECASH